MIRLPPDLSQLGEVRLAALDRATERELKREIDRTAATDPRFALALANALLVENEVNRRAAEPSE